MTCRSGPGSYKPGPQQWTYLNVSVCQMRAQGLLLQPEPCLVQSDGSGRGQCTQCGMSTHLSVHSSLAKLTSSSISLLQSIKHQRLLLVPSALNPARVLSASLTGSLWGRSMVIMPLLTLILVAGHKQQGVLPVKFLGGCLAT